MPFYTGSTRDGSDMKEFTGFPVSKCGKYWGSTQEDADNAWKMDIPETRKERRLRLRNSKTK
jgi:hypothetical protein